MNVFDCICRIWHILLLLPIHSEFFLLWKIFQGSFKRSAEKLAITHSWSKYAAHNPTAFLLLPGGTLLAPYQWSKQGSSRKFKITAVLSGSWRPGLSMARGDNVGLTVNISLKIRWRLSVSAHLGWIPFRPCVYVDKGDWRRGPNPIQDGSRKFWPARVILSMEVMEVWER